LDKNLLLIILSLIGLFSFFGILSVYAAQYINEDFNITFQYPDDWNVTQNNATTAYGLEQDVTLLFEINSPEIYKWKLLDSINYMSDTSAIAIVLYHDISDLKQFTKVVKKIMINTGFNIKEIRYDGRLIDYGNTSSVMILGNEERAGIKYLSKGLLFHEGNVGYLVGYRAPSKLVTDEHMHILDMIFDDIKKYVNK
jgi:hypothetical protein